MTKKESITYVKIQQKQDKAKNFIKKYCKERLLQKFLNFFNRFKQCLDDETINIRNKEVKPQGGLFQGPNDGLIFGRKLTNKQQMVIAQLFIISIYLIFKSIEGVCPGTTDDYCMDYINDNIIFWVLKFLLTAILINTTFILAYKRVIPPVTNIYLLVLSLYLIFGVYGFDFYKASLKEYGQAFPLALIICLTIIISIQVVCKFCYFLYKKHQYIGGTIVLGLLGLIIFCKVKQSKSCHGWEKGLYGEIDFGYPYCSINQPDTCYPVLFDDWLNFSPSQCPKNHLSKLQILESYNITDPIEELSEDEQNIIKNDDKYNFLALPLTNKFAWGLRRYEYVQKYVVLRTEPFSTKEEAFEEHEIVVGTQNEGLFVNVQRNQTLVEERKEFIENQEESVNSMAKNVIVIYMDTVSRAQAHRKLKKTMEFLKEFTGFGEEDSEQELFEFYRFHSVDKKTRNNMFTLHFEELYEDVYNNFQEYQEKYAENPKDNLFNEMKKAGYIVGHSSNTCTVNCLFRLQYTKIQSMFKQEPADHEMALWDPNYINKDNYYDFNQGPNSFIRRCLYGDDTSKYVFDYGQSFLDAYETEKKFLYLEFTDAHEVTSEVIQFIDDHIVNFLTQAKEKGHLNDDTIIHLLSDHGQHQIQGFFAVEKTVSPDDWEKAEQHPNKQYTNNVYHVERMLPLNMIIMKKSKFIEYPMIKQALKQNEQVIFGQREMRHTFLATAYGLQHSKIQGQQHLYNSLEKNNDCRDIRMDSLLHHAQFCICRPRFQTCEDNEEYCEQQLP